MVSDFVRPDEEKNSTRERLWRHPGAPEMVRNQSGESPLRGAISRSIKGLTISYVWF